MASKVVKAGRRPGRGLVGLLLVWAFVGPAGFAIGGPVLLGLTLVVSMSGFMASLLEGGLWELLLWIAAIIPAGHRLGLQRLADGGGYRWGSLSLRYPTLGGELVYAAGLGLLADLCGLLWTEAWHIGVGEVIVSNPPPSLVLALVFLVQFLWWFAAGLGARLVGFRLFDRYGFGLVVFLGIAAAVFAHSVLAVRAMVSVVVLIGGIPCGIAGLWLGDVVGGRVIRPGLLAFSQIGTFVRIMVPPMVGFAIGYLAILGWFAAVYMCVWSAVPNSFTIDGIVPRFGDFLFFSLMVLSTQGYSPVHPSSPAANVFVAAEVVAQMTWMVVVFAALAGYVGWKFQTTADTASKRGADTEPSVIGSGVDEVSERIESLADRLARLEQAHIESHQRADAQFLALMDAISEAQRPWLVRLFGDTRHRVRPKEGHRIQG